MTGPGHIRRRGEHSWELKFELGRDPVSGKRKIAFRSFKGTKREAAAELVRLIAQTDSGSYIDPIKVTVAEFLNRWDRDWASLNISPKTIERHRQAIRLHIVPHIGGLHVQKLRPADLAALYAKLAREGAQDGGPLSAATIRYAHAVLHRALGHAAGWGVVATNVAALAEPPSLIADSEEVAILTTEQIDAILKHLEGRTLRPIVSFMIGTGCRRGEVLALRWQDVDLDRGTVRIERSIEQTKAGLRIKPPKTKHGRRNVSISPWLVAELRAHRARQQERRFALGIGRAPDDSPVFARWDGNIRAPHWLSQKFAEAMRELRIGVHLHALRHTHVSQLIAAGLDVLTISRRIGHASSAITLDVYGHLFMNTDARAAEIIEAAFGGNPVANR
jgi:integrase